MGKHKDLSEFDKAKIVMTGLEHLQNCTSCGGFLASGQYPSKVVQGRNSGELATVLWAAKAH